jgi:hypothetical protein
MISRFIAFVLAVTAGILASQAPEFAQQYRQRLGGAIDELARVIDNFDQDAAASGNTQPAALALMARNSEPLVRSQSVSMAQTIIRHERLSEQQAAFENNPPFARLVVFFREFDGPLVESTLRSFEPAVPATAEGIVFAGIGFLVIYVVLRGLGLLFRPRRGRHHRHAAGNA